MEKAYFPGTYNGVKVQVHMKGARSLGTVYGTNKVKCGENLA